MKKLVLLILLLVCYKLGYTQWCGWDFYNGTTNVVDRTLYYVYKGNNVSPFGVPSGGATGYSWRISIDPAMGYNDNIGTVFASGANLTSVTFDPLATFGGTSNFSDRYVIFRALNQSSCTSPWWANCRKIRIVILDIPNPTVSSDVSICQGDSVLLTASDTVGTCEWYTGTCGGNFVDTGDSIYVQPSASTIYYVRSKNTNGNYSYYSGCSSVNVTVNSPPISINASGVTSFCPGGSVMLSSSSANSYLWNNSETTQDITVSTSGNYTVTVTDGNGCSATSSATTVTVNPLPTPSITVSGSATFCQGGNTTLNSNYAQGNQWIFNGNDILGAVAQSYSPTQSGFYTLFVTDNNSCQATSSAASITVNPSPDATITANGPTTFCQGESVSLSVSSANSYLWTNTETTQSITVLNSGNYSVSVTGANGCVSTSTQTNVTVHNLPNVPTILQNGNILMSSSSTDNQWYLNGDIIDGATSQFYTVTESGFYSVTVTDNFGCSNSSTPLNVNITGVDSENNYSDINIYPNPTANIFIIEVTLSSNSSIQTEIKNTLGQTIYTFSEKAASGLYKKTIDTNLAQGIYYLTLQTNEGRTTKKIEIIK